MMPEDISNKIETFFSDYKIRTYAKGQVLLLNGDELNYVYQLVTGAVKQYDVTYRGEEIILNIFKPPTFFPMSLAINKGLTNYIYEAETEVQLRQVPADKVVEFIKANPDVMFDLLARVYRGVDGLIGRMAQLMGGNASDRVIYELIIEAKRFGAVGQKGLLSLKISEKDLGARAGLSRETVSRELTKLKQEKLVLVHSKEIVIPQIKKLEKKLGMLNR